VTAAASVESPRLAPEQEETSPKPDAPKAEMPKAEMPKAEAFKVEPVKAESPAAEAAKAEPVKAETVKPETVKPETVKAEPPPIPGKLLIMSHADRAWNGDAADAEPEPEAVSEASSGKRRLSAMAAVVALATAAGAVGGALPTTGLGYVMGGTSAVADNSALESSVARIDADIVALKASVEHTSKMGMSQFNKTSDRLDKVEKAQAEPAARIAKLSEAVDKLRAQPAPAAVAAAPAREVTGSIAPPAAAAASVPLPASKPEVARLPTVEGWVIRDVGHGSALIEGRQGIFEVYAGDPIPGLGRVDAIRRQDGKWVVVTSKGLIVAR